MRIFENVCHLKKRKSWVNGKIENLKCIQIFVNVEHLDNLEQLRMSITDMLLTHIWKWFQSNRSLLSAVVLILL